MKNFFSLLRSYYNSIYDIAPSKDVRLSIILADALVSFLLLVLIMNTTNVIGQGIIMFSLFTVCPLYMFIYEQDNLRVHFEGLGIHSILKLILYMILILCLGYFYVSQRIVKYFATKYPKDITRIETIDGGNDSPSEAPQIDNE